MHEDFSYHQWFTDGHDLVFHALCQRLEKHISHKWATMSNLSQRAAYDGCRGRQKRDCRMLLCWCDRDKKERRSKFPKRALVLTAIEALSGKELQVQVIAALRKEETKTQT